MGKRITYNYVESSSSYTSAFEEMFDKFIVSTLLNLQTPNSMKNVSSTELQLHCYILSSGTNSLSMLIDSYSDHLMKYLTRWYKKHLQNNLDLVAEAVFTAIESYHEHPKTYNPEHGSLKRFLEISADKSLQMIFERENYEIHITGADHVLARYFDCEKDIQLAKLIMKNDNDMARYVNILGIGHMRISQQQSEIQRYKGRIKKTLDTIYELNNFGKKLLNHQPVAQANTGVIIYLADSTTNAAAYKLSGL